MRHVLLDVAFSRPPPPLSGGMPDGTSVACMIACAGTPAGVMPAKRGTCPRTVDLSPIAATADMHLLTAVRAHVQSVRFDGLHGAAHPGKHWTTPCREGIKARRPCPCGTRRKKKARGSAKNLSGPSLFGQPGHNGAGAAPVSRAAQLTTPSIIHAAPALRFAVAHPPRPHAPKDCPARAATGSTAGCRKSQRITRIYVAVNSCPTNMSSDNASSAWNKSTATPCWMMSFNFSRCSFMCVSPSRQRRLLAASTIRASACVLVFGDSYRTYSNRITPPLIRIFPLRESMSSSVSRPLRTFLPNR